MDLLLFIDKIHSLTCPDDQRLGKNEVDYKKVSYTFRIIQAAELPRMAIEYEDNWVPCEYSSKGIYTEKMLAIQVEKMTYSVDEIYLLSSVTPVLACSVDPYAKLPGVHVPNSHGGTRRE